MNAEELKKHLCQSLCCDVKVVARADGVFRVATPFTFSDGDSYSIHLQQVPSGIRLTDSGNTLMRLSYENDIDRLREGTRGRVYTQILNEMDLQEEGGAFFMDVLPDEVGRGVFRFGQALTKIHDLTFLNRIKTESTFYDDLKQSLISILGEDKLHCGYTHPTLTDAAKYPIDYFIQGRAQPVYLFGVPSQDKARLATIILERLLRESADFDSIIVFSNSEDIPRMDIARLMNAANDMVSSVGASEDLRRKLSRRTA